MRDLLNQTVEIIPNIDSQVDRVASRLEVELAASVKQVIDNTTRKSRRLEEQLVRVQSGLADATREFTGQWTNTSEQVAEASASLAERLAAFDAEIKALRKFHSASYAELQTTLQSEVGSIKGVLTNGLGDGEPGLLDTLEKGRADVSVLIADLTAFAREQREITRVFPRTIRMHTFVKPGALFEITSVMEEIRVERYGNEKDFTHIILDGLTDEDVFFDIGSSVGLVTINAAYKGVETYAFEPDPENRARLERNVELNHLENVTIVNWAVSDAPGEVTLYTDGLNGNSPSLYSRGDRGSVTVRADTIDAAIARGELKTPTVVKIDIEGAEGLAIEGMRDLFSSDDAPRAIFIEVHTDFLPGFGTTHEELTSLIESFGYEKVFEQDRMEQTHYIYHHE